MIATALFLFALDAASDLVSQIQPAIDAVKTKSWVLLGSIIVGALIRLTKPDVTWLPNIDAKKRAYAAFALGIAGGVLEAVLKKHAWPDAILNGLIMAAIAVAGHQVIVEGARGGREIGAPKSDSVNDKDSTEGGSS